MQIYCLLKAKQRCARAAVRKKKRTPYAAGAKAGVRNTLKGRHESLILCGAGRLKREASAYSPENESCKQDFEVFPFMPQSYSTMLSTRNFARLKFVNNNACMVVNICTMQVADVNLGRLCI